MVAVPLMRWHMWPASSQRGGASASAAAARIASSRWARCSRKVRLVEGRGESGDAAKAMDMIGDAGNEATNRYSPGEHTSPHPPPSCPPWLDQLSTGLAASRPDVSRRPRWPKEGGTRGYITRASVPKELVARLESDRLPGRGRQREATANWRCYLEYDSQTVGNWGESCMAALDHGRRSTELRISIALKLVVGRSRPV